MMYYKGHFICVMDSDKDDNIKKEGNLRNLILEQKIH